MKSGQRARHRRRRGQTKCVTFDLYVDVNSNIDIDDDDNIANVSNGVIASIIDDECFVFSGARKLNPEKNRGKNLIDGLGFGFGFGFGPFSPTLIRQKLKSEPTQKVKKLKISCFLGSF